MEERAVAEGGGAVVEGGGAVVAPGTEPEGGVGDDCGAGKDGDVVEERGAEVGGAATAEGGSAEGDVGVVVGMEKGLVEDCVVDEERSGGRGEEAVVSAGAMVKVRSAGVPGAASMPPAWRISSRTVSANGWADSMATRRPLRKWNASGGSHAGWIVMTF
ncbi:hypothetical protein [Actinoplanes sp. G11-F43]|uniref:hypothetical protein n=1 Tax=Actinoplanes sp. G11-F43 TaxID=3424130 RepID=UPI003D3488C4